MSTRIRLQRHGKKGKPFYHIVVADQRSKRDGKLIEKLGIYNPNTNPATIEINFDGAVNWMLKGAQPSSTWQTKAYPFSIKILLVVEPHIFIAKTCRLH